MATKEVLTTILLCFHHVRRVSPLVHFKESPFTFRFIYNHTPTLRGSEIEGPTRHSTTPSVEEIHFMEELTIVAHAGVLHMQFAYSWLGLGMNLRRSSLKRILHDDEISLYSSSWPRSDFLVISWTICKLLGHVKIYIYIYIYRRLASFYRTHALKTTFSFWLVK